MPTKGDTELAHKCGKCIKSCPGGAIDENGKYGGLQ